jgi:hypothetical protein
MFSEVCGNHAIALLHSLFIWHFSAVITELWDLASHFYNFVAVLCYSTAERKSNKAFFIPFFSLRKGKKYNGSETILLS